MMTDNNSPDKDSPSLQKSVHHWLRCPICGGRIQATVSVDMEDVHLSADGRWVVHDGSEFNSETERVYCENDHGQSEMIDYIAANGLVGTCFKVVNRKA